MAYLGGQIFGFIFSVLFFPHVLLCNQNPLGYVPHHCCPAFISNHLAGTQQQLPQPLTGMTKVLPFQVSTTVRGRVEEAEVIWKDTAGMRLALLREEFRHMAAKVGVENIPASAAPEQRSRHSVSAQGARK